MCTEMANLRVGGLLQNDQPFAGGIVYLAGSIDAGFHPEPAYLMYATAMWTASKIAFPTAGWQGPPGYPRDREYALSHHLLDRW